MSGPVVYVFRVSAPCMRPSRSMKARLLFRRRPTHGGMTPLFVAAWAWQFGISLAERERIAMPDPEPFHEDDPKIRQQVRRPPCYHAPPPASADTSGKLEAWTGVPRCQAGAKPCGQSKSLVLNASPPLIGLLPGSRRECTI
jgi:hypothetical protein